MPSSMIPPRPPTAFVPLFSTRDLSFHYPDQTQALSAIDLDVQAGDRIAVVGPNGSGKTTLVKLLCGLLMPTDGQVLFNGQPLTDAYLELSRLSIGVLFQDPDDQLFGHTLLDDVAFGPRQQGLSIAQAAQAARQALERVDLAAMAYKAPHNLSYGQKKRAALAGLLAMRPQVLLLDEPTTNLDPYQEELFVNLLQSFSGTLICISHDLILLYELCQRAVVIQGGRVRHDYTMHQLVAQRSALRAFGLDFSFRWVISPDPATTAQVTADPEYPPAVACPTAASPPLVELRDFRYRYPDGTTALRGIDLRIGEGERVAIVGENGAGKTTLLSCLLGLRQGSGQFRFAGEPVTRGRYASLWRQVQMVFQDCSDQLFCPSVQEEIAFGLQQLGLTRRVIDHRLQQALSQVRLQGFEDRVPLHLSGGERKRLALACVLAMQPRLLILDEPTAGLDPQGEELLLAILRALEATVLIVSHDMDFVRELTCRTLVMHQGLVLEDLPTAAFLGDQRLGNLNGLAFSFRQRSRNAISALQHEHEHSHPHQHLHSHPHRHGDVRHDHLHEHIHDHPHRFTHSHPQPEQPHDHRQRRYHDHDHLVHDKAPDDHHDD